MEVHTSRLFILLYPFPASFFTPVSFISTFHLAGSEVSVPLSVVQFILNYIIPPTSAPHSHSDNPILFNIVSDVFLLNPVHTFCSSLLHISGAFKPVLSVPCLLYPNAAFKEHTRYVADSDLQMEDITKVYIRPLHFLIPLTSIETKKKWKVESNPFALRSFAHPHHRRRESNLFTLHRTHSSRGRLRRSRLYVHFLATDIVHAVTFRNKGTPACTIN